MKLKHVALSLLFVISACGDPLDHKVPTDPAQWKQDTDFTGAIEKLPDEQKAHLRSYLMRAGMAEAFGGTFPDTTIGEAIQSQKDFQVKKAEEAKAEEEETARQVAVVQAAEAKRQKALEKARKALTVAVTSISFVKANFRRGTYQDTFALRIALKNNAAKGMNGVKGTVVFADMFGDEIKRVTLSVDDPIPTGEQVIWSGSLAYNQFMDEDTKLRSTELSKMKISWEPEVYLFADGTSMKMEE
jgi:hypothetical protein